MNRQFLIATLACVLAGSLMTACDPMGVSVGDEEKDPHFQSGKRWVGALDYKKAAEAFKRALETNPRSASAHFELALLYQDPDKLQDPAAAIYHFNRYLEIDPTSQHAGYAGRCISNCKMELASTILYADDSAKRSAELSRVAEENRTLQLRIIELERQLAIRPPPVTNYVMGTPTPPPTLPPSASAPPPTRPAPTPTPAPPASISARTYKVQSGDSLYSIARRYNVSVDAVKKANPGVNPDRLQIGQALKIPNTR